MTKTWDEGVVTILHVGPHPHLPDRHYWTVTAEIEGEAVVILQGDAVNRDEAAAEGEAAYEDGRVERAYEEARQVAALLGG